jgi:hypothetical protein
MVVIREDVREETLNVNGKDYWFVKSFANLTYRKEATIRGMINKGNQIRKLKHLKLGDRLLLIPAEELFEYPFVATGKTADEGIYVEKHYLSEDGLELLTAEEIYNHDQE